MFRWRNLEVDKIVEHTLYSGKMGILVRASRTDKTFFIPAQLRNVDRLFV